MRVFLKAGSKFVRTGWFWAFALLALPNCFLDSSAYENCPECGPPPCEGPECPPCEGPECPPVPFFDEGTNPTDAIMCEIPIPTGEEENLIVCATPDEAADTTIVSLSAAATALANGESSSFALDWSDLSVCPGDMPKKIEFVAGSFPDGHPICLGCKEQIPMVYATPTKACVAVCKDLVDAKYPGQLTPAQRDAHCEANARTATNFDSDACYMGVCQNNALKMTFFDPRRFPDPVTWKNLIGVSDNGGTNYLTRTTPASGMDPFVDWTEGAQSDEAITKGDAWIDFSSTTTTGAHAIGVRESRTPQDLPCVNVSDCPDNDASLGGIGISLDLNHLAQVYVIETVPMFASPGPFGADYYAGERFRIHVKDRHNGTAEISYARIDGQCDVGTKCEEDVFYISTIFPRYPLRVDTSFRDPSEFADVRIVRIKQ